MGIHTNMYLFKNQLDFSNAATDNSYTLKCKTSQGFGMFS